MNEKIRNSVVYYTTATCNLNCRYCYIDKNPALKEIDDLLDESFKGDYYFNFTKKMFPDKNQLKIIQFWGGEPFLRLDRAYYTVKKVLDYYPKVYEFDTSTNFINEPFFNQFFGLLNILEQYSPREFKYDLQLSLDGPSYINDAGRGEGVTNKFLDKYDIFMEKLKNEVPKNVKIELHFKPTLDNDSFRKINSKEKIIEYYLFFENLYEKVLNINNPNVEMFLVVPNMAVPSTHTKQDGIEFANFIRNCIEVEKENKQNKIFKYYKHITPFIPRDKEYLHHKVGYCCPGGTCSTGRGMVGLLPNDLISECHMSFVDVLGSYKEYADKHRGGDTTIDFKLFTKERPIVMTFPYQNIDLYENKINAFYKNQTIFRQVDMVTQIQLLAYNNQIDKKYMNEDEALKAAYFIQEASSNCVRDHVAVLGTLYIYPLGQIRLFLNGTKDLIEQMIMEDRR